MTTPPTGPLDLTRLLPSGWSDNPTWQQLFETMSTYFYQEVDAPRRLLSTVRDFETVEDWYAVLTLQMMGFPSPLSGFNTVQQHLLLLRSWGIYNLSRGASGQFVNLLGWLLNAYVNISPLWTTDFVNFVTVDQVPINGQVWNGGNYYPTTWLDLTYNSDQYQVDDTTLREYFYALAPIHLVLRNILGTLSAQLNMYVTPFGGLIEQEIIGPLLTQVIPHPAAGTPQNAWTINAKSITTTIRSHHGAGNLRMRCGIIVAPSTGILAIPNPSTTTPRTVLLPPGTTSWLVDPTWNDRNNLVECIGQGGYGYPGNSGGGGGGGAYAATSNITLTPGNSIPVQIGINNAPFVGPLLDTSFNGGVVLAKAGSGGSGNIGGQGGQASASVGTVKYSGGNGGNAASFSGQGAGGGGAAGPNGAGQPGQSAPLPPGGTGGNGDNNLGGAGGLPWTTVAGNGTEWGINGGSGGGGGGNDGGISQPAGQGGNYGGGGGGAGGPNAGGTGAGGAIRITWFPIIAQQQPIVQVQPGQYKIQQYAHVSAL